MRFGPKTQVYQAVSAVSEGLSAAHRAQHRKKTDQFNFKPVPLRTVFLTTFVLIFAICIALIEVLLHNTSKPVSQATSSSTSSPTSPRSLKRHDRQHVPIFRRQYLECTELAAIPEKLLSLSQISSSLCAEFTETYLAHEANLSWPLQTGLSHWLIPFNAMTSSTRELTALSAYCDTTSPPETYASGSVVKTVPVGCSSGTIELASDVCTGFGTIWITNFALTSTINPVCGVSTSAVLVPTSQSREGSVSSVISGDLLVTDTRGVDPDETLEPSKPTLSSVSSSASGAASSDLIVPTTPDLPTITLANTPTPAPTPVPASPDPTLPTVTLPADPVQTPPGDSDTGSPPTAAITNPPPATQATGSAAAPAQTIVTNLDAIVPIAATYTIEDSAGAVHTIVTAVDPLAPVAATYMVTDTMGQVEAVVTNIGAVAPLQATYTFTDSSGAVQTAVAAFNALSGSSSVFTTVNALGQIETLVAIVGTPAATSLTYLVTDSDGHVETVVTALNAPANTLSTYIRTNAGGQVETVITPVQALVEPLATYTTTRNGKVETIITSQALEGSLTTYTTTHNGKVETVVTLIQALADSLTTYMTTNDGKVETVVATLGATATGSATRYTTTTQYTSVVTTTGADGRVTSFSAIVVETVVLTTSPVPQTLTPTKTSSATAKSSATRPPQPSFELSSSEKVVNGTFTEASYFLSMYFAPLVAVVIKAMWEIVFAAIKLMQPFERMATPVGTDAQYSLFAQYLSSSISFDMFNSIGHGNLLPLWSAVMFLIVQIGAPLAAASMTVKSRDICIIDGMERRCDPTWVVNVSMLRALEGVLVACLILVLLVLWSTWKTRSGISCDPSSFASLALLINHEALLQDVQQVDPDADHSVYEAVFEGYRFRLGYHINAADQRMYGIISSSGSTKLPELDDESTAYRSNGLRSGTHRNYQAVHNPATTLPASSYARTSSLSRTRHNFITDMLGFLFPLTLLTLVLTFYLDENLDDIFNRFFNSNTIAPKLVLVGLAALSSLHLSHLERSVRITEPFRRLAANAPQNRSSSFFSFLSKARKIPAPAETTLLISRSGTYYSNIPQCLTLLVKHEIYGGRMIFQTLISLTAILADLNIIAVAGVPYNSAMTLEVYQGSCIASLAISSWIVLMYMITLFWWRRNEVIQVVGGRSISKGVGTIGGLVRWLVGGGPDVVEAIVKVKDERELWRGWKRKYGDENGGGGTQVWFGRTGVVGAHGRERWCLDFGNLGETSAMRKRRGSAQGLRQWF